MSDCRKFKCKKFHNQWVVVNPYGITTIGFKDFTEAIAEAVERATRWFSHRGVVA